MSYNIILYHTISPFYLLNEQFKYSGNYIYIYIYIICSNIKKLCTLPITIGIHGLLTGLYKKNGMCFLWIGTGVL